MRIEILDEAEQDLVDGFAFYERQSKGLGDYFLDSIFSDVESLYIFMAGFTLCTSGITDFWPNVSPSPSTIGFRTRLFASMQYSIAGGTRPGFAIASCEIGDILK